MSDPRPTRKDGRPLVWDYPVTAEDEIEIYMGPIPDGVTCVYRSSERPFEARMDEV